MTKFFLLSDNYIDGNEFTKLTEAEVKDLVPPIGLAKKVIRMIPKVCAYPVLMVMHVCAGSLLTHPIKYSQP